MKDPISLHQLIVRLQELEKHLGEHNSEMTEVRFTHNDEECVVTGAIINQDPHYNFDEANCGSDEWVEINYV